METEEYTWDIFLAHAGVDAPAAEELYGLLEQHCKVFLDTRCLLLGDDWDNELALAQRKSLVTVVLVSSRTEQAYYQREEIAAAIDMARKDKDKHRVVPVFLGNRGDEIIVPYGLRLKHGLFLPKVNGLSVIAERLVNLLSHLKHRSTGEQHLPRFNQVSPLTGWEIIDLTKLSGLTPLREREIIRFFDGATPNWRHAVSDAIPHRDDVQIITKQLRTALNANDACAMNIILSAGGEGKSTMLLQSAVELIREERCLILWRSDPAVGLEPQEVVKLDEARSWVLVADEAEDLVGSLWNCAGQLNQMGRTNVHFLLAARDADWRAAKGYSRGWASRFPPHPFYIYLRGLKSRQEAIDLIKAWERFGEAGLRRLAGLSSLNERVKAFEQAVRDEETGRNEGSFFGGLLTARFDEEGLRAHVTEFLDRLQRIEIEDSSYSLFNALLYIASCHGVGIPGVSEVVLADLMGIPRQTVYTRVVNPLGEESAAVRSARHVLTRHKRVAATILTQVSAAFGVDLAEIWSELVKQTVRTGRGDARVGQSHPKIVNASPHLQKALPKEIPEQKRKEIAIAAALASVEVEGDRVVPIVNLGRTYRAADMLNDAVEVFRGNLSSVKAKVDYLDTIRAYWYEWAVCESERGADQSVNAWLSGLSVSDYLEPAPITADRVKMTYAGLGVAFGKLAQPNPGDAFARGRRAAAYLGKLSHRKLASPDPRNFSYLVKHEQAADKIGTPHPVNTDDALGWLETGIQAAWHRLEDEFLREFINPTQLTFHKFRNFFRDIKT